MSIPKYILKAADEYVDLHIKRCNDMFGEIDNQICEVVRNAFIAGYESTKRGKSSDVVLDANQEKMFDDCWDAYEKKGNKALAKRLWLNIPSSSYPVILGHIKAYVSSREKRFTKDFERYLKEKEYTKIVFSGNHSIFDPSQYDKSEEYHPLTDDIFQTWNEERKCLMFNGDLNHLYDGYADDNRPDGAMVSWGMYSWKWNKQLKQWVEA